MAPGMVMLVSHPLWSRLKYLGNYGMDCNSGYWSGDKVLNFDTQAQCSVLKRRKSPGYITSQMADTQQCNSSVAVEFSSFALSDEVFSKAKLKRSTCENYLLISSQVPTCRRSSSNQTGQAPALARVHTHTHTQCT